MDQSIDWVRFKEWKVKHRDMGIDDNLVLLTLYIKTYFSLQFDDDAYKIIKADSLGESMLERKNIEDANGFCFYIQKHN